MYYHRRRSRHRKNRVHGRRRHRTFPWPFFVIAFIFFGNAFTFWMLLIMGIIMIQFISNQTRKSEQTYQPPQYLGSPGPTSQTSEVPVYFEEPLRTTSSSKSYCYECGGKVESGRYCHFCGTDQQNF